MKQAGLPTFRPLALKTKLTLVSCDNNNALETLEVIDNACKYGKYKKIKDVHLPEINNDIRDFIQNEVKHKINLHNQEKYQTVVDKKLITNLEREIEFLKSEISTKNEIIKNLLNNDVRQNKSYNMVGETWDFDATHETSDSESTYSTSNSEDPIVESRDVNTVNTEISNTSIDDQLKMIREEKHQEYIQNTGCNSPSSEKPKIKKTRQFSDPQARKENINETAETNEEFHWPSVTCAIVGDSMVNGIDEKKLQKHGNVKVFFSGARINDMNHLLMPIIAKRPDHLILHVGTNDVATNTSIKIIDDLLRLKCNILKQLPNCRVLVSRPTVRTDNGKANLSLRNVNRHLEILNLECIENDNISAQHLGRKRLHLNSKGKGRLALNFLNQIRKF